MNASDEEAVSHPVSQRGPMVVPLDALVGERERRWEHRMASLRRALRWQGDMGVEAGPEPVVLAWRGDVLSALRSHRQAGRSLWLDGRADPRIARDAAAQLELFDRVLVDQADPAEGERFTPPSEQRRPAGPGVWLRATRVHQWTKNLLLAVPMLVGHELAEPWRWGALLLGIISFSLVASAVYLLNDLLDLPADRQHPHKRERPLASGALSIPAGLGAIPLLLGGSLLAGVWLGSAFVAGLGLYFLATLGYSLGIKGKAILDVMWLAGLYTLRVLMGGVAVGVPVSAWLLGLLMFMSLSLAFVKRYAELHALAARGGQKPAGRGYRVEDLNLIGTLGPVSGYLGVLVFAVYISSNAVRQLYAEPSFLWLVVPLAIYWISRIWLKTQRGELMEDPVVFALRDRLTWGLGAVTAVLVVLATVGAR